MAFPVDDACLGNAGQGTLCLGQERLWHAGAGLLRHNLYEPGTYFSGAATICYEAKVLSVLFTGEETERLTNTRVPFPGAE